MVFCLHKDSLSSVAFAHCGASETGVLVNNEKKNIRHQHLARGTEVTDLVHKIYAVLDVVRCLTH